jgi:hypothetical protein
MPQSHAIQDQQAVQELMITELLAELQAIDDKARMVVRFCKVMDLNSQHEM